MINVTTKLILRSLQPRRLLIFSTAGSITLETGCSRRSGLSKSSTDDWTAVRFSAIHDEIE